VRIVPTLDAYDVFDTPGVAVVSAETTDVGVVDLPYRGIPTPKDVTVSYDTLKQQVTLRWGEAAGRAGMTYNVHRRDIDPTTALFTQLNIFPVPDTFYVDSLCERNKTYEYRVTAADSNATEGMKSAGVRVRIALFPLVPKNVAIAYDTARQTIRVHWGNPDAAIVTGFNVYRRNIDLGESFWTPFNKGPILDTCLVDSTYNLCPNCDPACDDASPPQPPTYEYCVGAIIKNLREGARSDSVRARICLDNVRPKNVRISYDTVGHAVRLRWRRPETALVTRFNVYKRNCGGEERFLSQINKEPIGDTLFTDTACTRNQRYEYCVASLVEKNRSEAKSEVIGVLITAPFIAADDPAAAQ
jgi:fibronectin type 3 domain-containing protein